MSSGLVTSFSPCVGVDTSRDIPNKADRSVSLSRAINRSMGRLLNDTRPPFIELEVKFQSTEDEETFRNAAISGMKYYTGEPPLFSSFLIVVVGDLILAGYIKPNSIEFFRIYKGIDPQWMHSFFGQALNILTWNNGKDLPLYWTGNPLEQFKPVYQSAYVKGAPMIVSNLSTFANGRLHVCTPFNLVYSSDFIYAQGLAIEQRESVLSFSESQYPSSGDGFGAPSEMGQISGIVTIPQSNTLNGHGDIMVMCRNGAFSIATNRKIRNEWTSDTEMQKTVIVGKGCIAHDSIVLFANQLMYRDSIGGISSLNLDISNFQNNTEMDEVSQYASRYLDYDINSSDVRFATSVISDRRMLSSVAHMKEESTMMGIHRYGRGLVSAVKQKQGNKTVIGWEGMWTGIRPVASAFTNVGNVSRTIFASYDEDGKNRLYYLDETSRGDDFSDGKHVPIISGMTFGHMLFDETPDTALVEKKLEKIEVLITDSNPVTFTASYGVNGADTQFPISFQLTEIVGCGDTTARYVSDTFCNDINPNTSKLSTNGYYFDLSFRLTGVVKLSKTCVMFTVSNTNGFETGTCNKVKSSDVTEICFTEQSDCIQNDFYYALPYGQR